ncbi:nitrate/sulfonate/bicarbonate ABC transporter ATP-binding protein [Fluoribacter gormanii]|uniref:Aliphatic sulfonates import ATP-binding protein SsuB n=1 Tax=Fluoribacter gormanii TaxID=464 RepID=A0A377GNA1_9GAMM|nr:nitrate/sulfonate/bicarbonate ABC transporter ATP-binding protein [Fluoribacter gormanii]KTD04720.1 ABC transporter ATP binding protein [Fluoribacter gormanii]MCW8445356.1 nitrate/sulfonate/bicarbonate ABC transporter ATP-binding protein [Fluoribacter gormanii]MCW8470561.1 nitrate/sulfonate/bicarbonate ABC transporter ATP-binding protein [Fluoribacter gormanii]SIR14333.1 NitT/TauT family transport system ATP-binding protein [Fluoribacter gormanii]STO26280.1 Aliphatic sulfonates import ATP-b
MSETIIAIESLRKSFKKAAEQNLLVLEDVNFKLQEGEIVALLGKSGSGKSTLLRIIAGLIAPTSGTVTYRGKPVTSPVAGIAMVFQSFALMPWLTVLENVELGLEAQGVSREERRHRAIEAIDIIGLDGFESAFPKELSGGMRQRVGFARALVINPDVLLMDEPFSALDVLTAENLKSDLLELWAEKKTNTNGILLVTHNIEEAATLADRIVIFGNDPGYIRAELPVTLPQPRDPQSPEFRALVDKIYTLMTTGPKEKAKRAQRERQIGLGYRLPDVEPSELTGLIETMTSFEERIDLPELADELMMNIDDLFPILETLEILGFAKVSAGDIQLSDLGKQFAEADLQERKQLFAQRLLEKVPLARYIRRILDEKVGHRVSEERFLSKLEDYLSEKEADRVLRTMIDWGRYAEIFAYDFNTGILSLENPGKGI